MPMKYDPNQDWREKREVIRRLAVSVSARKRPFELTPLTDEAKAHIEDVTRFEQLRGRVLKQNGRRARFTLN